MATHDDVEHFDRRAETYEHSWIQRYVTLLHDMLLDAAAAQLKGNDPQRILDMGCGTGRLLRAAAGRWPRAELVGVDPAAQMVDVARKESPSTRFEVAPAEALPLPDATADLVLTSISLHHWTDQPKGLREAARVLRPGGVLCLADIVLPGWVARMLGSRARSAAVIRRMLEASGLHVIAQQRACARRIAIAVARKPG